MELSVMTDIQLFRPDTSSPQKVELLADVLRSFIPFSLPLLGTFYSGDLEGGYLSVWTTFDVSLSEQRPELFSVITFSPLGNDKLWFFCSAEARSEPPTVEEQDHVSRVVKTLYHAFRTSSSIVRGIQTHTAFREADGHSGVIVIGSLHEKWAPCLQAIAVADSPCTKFLRPPPSSLSLEPWNISSSDKWDISELRESDVDLVTDRVVFKRSRESMLTRLRYSVGIRPKGSDTPVAWQLLYPDGSIGMLHVEPEYRRLGLAKMCIHALSRKLEEMFRSEEEGKGGQYPWSRWEFVDVVAGNEKSSGLLKSLEPEGWREGWVCYWVYLAMNDVEVPQSA
ncbi:unnamed protein product [Somion occarium]|uniref:GCN5-related N-acetyltransferase Rv2170-like domain-containing protein n=1 Tax=Somion occarium TaxID=3059160 RepID=A0ABP1DBD8_9APHY